jgi:GT2 family glycosyltransferase
MALIAMAVYDTAENKRTELTRETLLSLRETVDFSRHRLVVSDNGSILATRNVYELLSATMEFRLILNGKNVGTAAAINRAWALHRPNEVCVKMDNDVVIHHVGWLDEIEEVFQRDPSIGIVGLKRKDLEGNPNSDIPYYRSTLRMLPHDRGQRWIVVEEVNHIMGTCEALSPRLLDKIGYLDQMEGLYGFDDSLVSLRCHLAGFRTVFLPHIEIDHIDPGQSAYTDWKVRYVAEMMDRYNQRVAEYRSGARSLYYPGETA